MGLKFRRCLTVFLAFGMLLTVRPCAAEDAPAAMRVEMEETRVTVRGVLPDMPEELVMLAVYKDDPAAGIGRGNTCFIGQTASDSKGSYGFVFGLEETDGAGYYRFLIQSRSMEAPLTQELLYVREAVLERAFSLITNAADAAALAAAWQTEANVRLAMESQGLLAEDLTLLSGAEQQQVAQAVLDGGQEDWTELAASFNPALAILRVNGAKKTGLADMLEQYQAALGLPLGAESAWAKLGAYQSRVTELLDRARPFSPKAEALAEVQSAFSEALAIVEVNTATAGTIAKVLENYETVLGIDLSGDYSRLTSSEQTLVRAALVGQNFSTAAAIKRRFEEKVKKPGGTTTPNGTGGGTGGGGGRPGGGSVTGAVEVTGQDKQPETTDPPEQEPVFRDLEEVPWAVESILRLAERGIINGVGDRTFAPQALLTREQYVKMLMLAFGLTPQDAEEASGFADVEPDAWYAPYIAAASRIQLVNGYDARTFGVGRHITRQEMAAMMWRAALYTERIPAGTREAETFLDEGAIAPYAREAVRQMQRAGIINGVGDGNFAPEQNASRAEAAKMLDGLLTASEV